jgi:hypothetical protein
VPNLDGFRIAHQIMTPLQKRTAATPRAQRTLMMDARRCMRARDRKRIFLCERRVAAVTYSICSGLNHGNGDHHAHAG